MHAQRRQGLPCCRTPLNPTPHPPAPNFPEGEDLHFGAAGDIEQARGLTARRRGQHSLPAVGAAARARAAIWQQNCRQRRAAPRCNDRCTGGVAHLTAGGELRDGALLRQPHQPPLLPGAIQEAFQLTVKPHTRQRGGLFGFAAHNLHVAASALLAPQAPAGEAGRGVCFDYSPQAGILAQGRQLQGVKGREAKNDDRTSAGLEWRWQQHFTWRQGQPLFLTQSQPPPPPTNTQ